MDISVTYMGRDGKRKHTRLEGVGLPRSQDVKRRKGETKDQAFKRTVETVVRRAVFGAVNAELGQLSGEVAKKRGKRMSKAQAHALLNKAKKSRGVKFGVEFYRED